MELKPGKTMMESCRKHQNKLLTFQPALTPVCLRKTIFDRKTPSLSLVVPPFEGSIDEEPWPKIQKPVTSSLDCRAKQQDLWSHNWHVLWPKYGLIGLSPLLLGLELQLLVIPHRLTVWGRAHVEHMNDVCVAERIQEITRFTCPHNSPSYFSGECLGHTHGRRTVCTWSHSFC